MTTLFKHNRNHTRKQSRNTHLLRHCSASMGYIETADIIKAVKHLNEEERRKAEKTRTQSATVDYVMTSPDICHILSPAQRLELCAEVERIEAMGYLTTVGPLPPGAKTLECLVIDFIPLEMV